MLEELDSIDWKAIGSHVSGSNEHIPVSFRQLLSDDKATREYALEFLLGQGPESGQAYPTAPPILRLLFGLLSDAAMPDKALLLEYMIVSLEIAQGTPYSVANMRRRLAIYDLFTSQLPLLFELLYDADEAVRLNVMDMLASFPEEIEEVFPRLIECFQGATSEAICLRILQTLKELWGRVGPVRHHWKPGEELYARFLQDIITAHALPRVRVAAARCITSQLRPYKLHGTPLLETVSAMLIKEFFEQSVIFEFENHGWLHSTHLVQEIAQLTNGDEVLGEILHHPALDPAAAHMVGRGLLVAARVNSVDASTHWKQHPHYHKRGEEVLYGVARRTTKIWNSGWRATLTILLESDAFWAVPSNLLSFCYGLPDDREELRALLEAQ
jgi:hypothetical protein